MIKIVYRKLGREKAWGQAHLGENTIEVDPSLKGKHKLEIIIHEALHIQNKSWEEDEVVEKSKELAELLYAERLRFIEKE